MVAIPFPLSTAPGFGPQDSQGRLINVYAWDDGGAKRWRSAPGLDVFCDTNLPRPRGFLDVNGSLYAAYEDRALRISSTGQVTTLTGPLSGTEPVTWARNNRAVTPDVVVVTEYGAFVVVGNALQNYPDVDLDQPNSVSFLDGYLIFTIGDGRIFASDLNSTTVNSLSFTKAESKPDGLLRGVVKGAFFIALGPSSIEFYQNAATSPFPLARVAVLTVGLISPWAIAGHEDGWQSDIVFVASDCTIQRLNGPQAERISNPALERAISMLPDKDQLRAQVYTFGGHAMWSLSAPSWTWELNLSTGNWHERRSLGGQRWRAQQSVWWQGRWYLGDSLSTNLLRLDEFSRHEAGDQFESVIESGPAAAFPNRARVNKADFLFNQGMGRADGADPIETDPRVVIAWSDDGGAVYGNPLHRPLGKQGDYLRKVMIAPAGMTSQYGRRWRVGWSDPVDVTFLGGDMTAQALGR